MIETLFIASASLILGGSVGAGGLYLYYHFVTDERLAQ
jgi:hypothetical protein